MEINPRDIAALASTNPAQGMSAAIITGTVQEGAKMESAVRVATPITDPNKGQKIDVTV